MSGFNTETLNSKLHLSSHHLTTLFPVPFRTFPPLNCGTRLRDCYQSWCAKTVCLYGGSAREPAAVICAGTSVRTNCLLRPPPVRTAASVSFPSRICPQGAVINHVFLLVCHIFVPSQRPHPLSSAERWCGTGATAPARCPARAAAWGSCWERWSSVVSTCFSFSSSLGCSLPFPQVLHTVRFPQRCYHSCLLKNSIV